MFVVMGEQQTFPRIWRVVIRECFHRRAITSFHLEENIPDIGEKCVDTHKHKIPWYGLIHLALMIVGTVRKIKTSMIDLNSGKPRHREFYSLERRKHGK